MKNIAVFTSGGDAPGMNACVRAVVRSAGALGCEVYGIYRGYQGMIEGDIRRLRAHDVSNIIQRGGTFLKSARSKDFMTPEGRKRAFDQLSKHRIEGVVVIGGDGSFRGALEFSREYGIPFIGCPGTIDNDLFGSDYTLGYDTALNTVIRAVDNIRDTADSHDRLFFVEVMGRDAGFIALNSGLASGAEAVLIPETKTYMDALIDLLRRGWKRKKSSAIIIVAEGDESGGAFEVAREVESRFDKYETRVTVLGHIQRGGSPSAYDRILGSRLGHAAVAALLEGKENEMAGISDNKLRFTPFEKAIKQQGEIDTRLLGLVEILSS